MKRILYPVLSAILAIIAVSAGCQSSTPDTGNQEIEIRSAPIHEVQVNIAESYPVQIFVYIKGGLRDSCTTFHELKVERSGNTVNIEVTTERPRKATCAQVYGYFEENVALGSDFTSGETYTVRVNDYMTGFVMQ